MAKSSLLNYKRAVAQKLNDPAVRRLLTFGNTKGLGPRIRDAEGLQHTFSTIMKSAENLHFITEGRDAFATSVRGFSTGTGYEIIDDVKTVGAIDLTILQLSTSLIPFICIDRPMDTPDATIYFNNLVALNDAGGVKPGEVVSGNFTAPNPDVNLGSLFADKFTLSASGPYTLNVNKELLPRNIAVTLAVEDASGTVTKTVRGRDYQGDGNILFPPEAYQLIESATVTYTGDTKIEITPKAGLSEKVSGIIHYQIDASRNNDGQAVLHAANDWQGIPLHTIQQNIVVEDNIANRMYMAKAGAVAGSKTSVNDIMFTRTKNTFIEYLNAMVIKNMVAHAEVGDIMTQDLSGYNVSDYAATKNDLVTLFISSMSARFQGNTGILPTAIITGSYGVTLLKSTNSTGTLWVDNPDVAVTINGLAGWFQGIPVYRHNFLNYNNNMPNVVDFYMVAKLADNSSGSMVYGEFLPLTSTGVVSNFNMPTNIASGYFCQSGVKVVLPHLILKGQITLPVNIFKNIQG